MSQVGTHIVTVALTPQMRWDAALTLGTCIIVCGAVISPMISMLYKRWRKDDHRLWNTLLGIMLVSLLYMGSMLAVLLLGYWAAWILEHLGIMQGVLLPWTIQQPIPLGELS